MARMSLRKQIVASLLLIALLLVGCGGDSLLKSFRVALDSSRPLINALVASGAISNEQAGPIATDFDDGAKCGLALQEDFKVATTRAEKFAASSKALTCFQTIIDRQHFAAHPKVQQASSIAKGILESLAIFYSDSTDTADGPRRAPVRRESEKAFEERIKAEVEVLKEALKP